MQKQLFTRILQNSCLRCSRSQMFFKIGVLKNFCNIHMKISVLESLFNKVDSKDIKKAQTQVFFCEYCEVFKSTFFTELLRWLFWCFKKVRIFSGNHWWRRLNTFVFFINTTEFNMMLMCYLLRWLAFCIFMLLE